LGFDPGQCCVILSITDSTTLATWPKIDSSKLAPPSNGSTVGRAAVVAQKCSSPDILSTRASYADCTTTWCQDCVRATAIPTEWSSAPCSIGIRNQECYRSHVFSRSNFHLEPRRELQSSYVSTQPLQERYSVLNLSDKAAST
jgi:hypothetical protein